jgi:hypothetical protein
MWALCPCRNMAVNSLSVTESRPTFDVVLYTLVERKMSKVKMSKVKMSKVKMSKRKNVERRNTVN